VFCSSFVRAFKKASQCGGEVQPLLDATCAFCRIVEMSENHIQEEPIHAMHSFMKGILKLCSPVPGLHNATLADVEYSFPKTVRVPPFGKAFGKEGALLVSMLRESAVWRQRYDEVLKYSGSEEANLEEYLQLDGCCRRLESHVLSKSPDDSVTPEMEARLLEAIQQTFYPMLEKLPAWRGESGFRPDGTLKVEGIALRYMQHVTGVFAAMESVELRTHIDKLGVIRNSARLLRKTPDRDTCIQTLNDLILQHNTRNVNEGMSKITTTVLKLGSVTTGELEDLAKLLSDSAGRLDATLKQDVIETLDCTFSCALQYLRTPAPGELTDLGPLLSKVWEAAVDQQIHSKHCRQALKLFRHINELAATMAKLTEMQHKDKNYTKVFHSAIGLWHELNKLDRLDGEVEPVLWERGFFTFFDEQVEVVQADLKAPAVVSLDILAKPLKRSMNTLKQIAGGASGGALWHANAPSDSLAHAEGTLLKININQIAAALTELRAKLQAVQDEIVRVSILKDPSLEAYMSDERAQSQDAIDRAELTRCERRCVMCLLGPASDKTKDRIQRYISEFQGACFGKASKDWTTLMPKDLVGKLKAKM
jgi:hypothetical protein